MAKLENNEQQLTALEKYELAKECFEKDVYAEDIYRLLYPTFQAPKTIFI